MGWREASFLEIGDTAVRSVEQDGRFRIVATTPTLFVFADLAEKSLEDSGIVERLGAQEPFERANLRVENPVDADAEDIAPAVSWWEDYLGEKPGPMCMVCDRSRNDRLPIPWDSMKSLCESARSDRDDWKKWKEKSSARERTMAAWMEQVRAWTPKRSLSEVEIGVLEDLEQYARGLEDVVALEPTVENLATATAKRRFLLPQLDAAGILAAESGDRLEKFPLLHSYWSAARELDRYFRSPQRAERIPRPPPPHLLAAEISLDFFRFPPAIAPGDNLFDWLGWSESFLEDGHAPGESFIHQGRDSGSLHFRIEDGFRSVLWKAEYSFK